MTTKKISSSILMWIVCTQVAITEIHPNTTRDHDFKELALCAQKNHLASELFRVSLKELVKLTDDVALKMGEYFARMAILHGDTAERMFSKMSEIALEENWSENQMSLRFETATSAYMASEQRKIENYSTSISDGDMNSWGEITITYPMQISSDAMLCNIVVSKQFPELSPTNW